MPAKPEITIQNIVFTGDLGQAIHLNAIAIGLGLESIEYEPELFPGLVYRLDDPSVVVLLFGSGKTVITGCECVDAAKTAIETVHDQLLELDVVD
jgi:transcription initiation factor TFIID TATA-box-binding protein